MKHISLLIGFCFSVMILLSCQQTNSPKGESGIVGQIYEVGSPAEPVGWTPPPLKGARTIVVSDTNKVDFQMLTTDTLGAFKISLQAGTYFLLVKDTIRPQGQNGPFTVVSDQVTSVKVYHDNGVR